MSREYLNCATDEFLGKSFLHPCGITIPNLIFDKVHLNKHLYFIIIFSRKNDSSFNDILENSIIDQVNITKELLFRFERIMTWCLSTITILISLLPIIYDLTHNPVLSILVIVPLNIYFIVFIWNVCYFT